MPMKQWSHLISKFFLFPAVFLLIGCSLKAQFTFTESQSAAEKQLIGEEKEIEKDGWLLSSLKTSATGPEEWKSVSDLEFSDKEKAKEYIELVKTAYYTAPEVRKLKLLHFAGESLSGKLQILDFTKKDDFNKEYPDEKARNKAKQIIELVNSARERLIQLKTEKLPEEERKKMEDSFRKEFIANSLPGEYCELKKSVWELKNE